MNASIQSPGLFEHGIAQEVSDIRAHVSYAAKMAYIFQTHCGQNAAVEWEHQSTFAGQPGVNGYTSRGIKVPWVQIEGIREISIADLTRFTDFTPRMSTSQKGQWAQDMCCQLLNQGRFPFWFEGSLIDNRELQIQGMDIVVNVQTRIQVKCDARCGRREFGGTGNIYIETHECNPLRRW